jgi:TetR/AcrR family transcriptional regulator, transcriptional repressor for nem operon
MKNPKLRLIIRQGYKHMQKHGYYGTSIDDVLDSIQIPKGSFYYYFKSKEQFAVEVLDYYCQSVIKSIDKILLNSEISPRDRVLKMYSDYIDNYINKGHFSYGNFAGKLAQEVGDKIPEIRQAAVQYFDHVRDTHILCLNEAKKAGEIGRGKDAGRIADFIIYSWEGAVMRMKASGNVKPLFVFRELLKNML